MLKKLLVDSSKLVPNPNPAEVAAGRETVFHTWVKYAEDANSPGNPSWVNSIDLIIYIFKNNCFVYRVGNMGGGSDFAPFAYVVGTPTTDFGYTVILYYFWTTILISGHYLFK